VGDNGKIRVTAERSFVSFYRGGDSYRKLGCKRSSGGGKKALGGESHYRRESAREEKGDNWEALGKRADALEALEKEPEHVIEERVRLPIRLHFYQEGREEEKQAHQKKKKKKTTTPTHTKKTTGGRGYSRSTSERQKGDAGQKRRGVGPVQRLRRCSPLQGGGGEQRGGSFQGAYFPKGGGSL